ncbi:MAG: hypothetical protein EAZ74_01605 [Alphaproteobacteria bacterium]|nr:MAG: hypothetical protein EAY76_06695 [Alphaproteobacteria bacterium]TAF15490.1 MAG: hypothetical protein EAZ74_01605 [Alphaproteobacteria bacterium]
MMAWSQLGQVLFSFLFVIGLMFALSYLVRRFGLEKKWQYFKSSSGTLRLEDSLFLDAKRRMMVIGMEDKRYVVLLDSERAHIVDTLPRAVDPALTKPLD